MKKYRFVYLFNGLGAGNIGDDAMFEGWCRIQPPSARDIVEVSDPFTAPITFRHRDVPLALHEPAAGRDAHLAHCEAAVLLGLLFFHLPGG